MPEIHELPVGWTRPPLGELLRRRTERASGKEPLLSVTQARGVILQAEVGRRDSSSDEKTNYWRALPGDIVYNTMRMWQGISGRSDLSGIVSPAYTVCEPSTEVDSRFLAHLFKHPDSITEFYRLSQGLVSDTWNLKYSSFAAIRFAIPPKRDQRRIAEILDAVDTRIDHVSALLRKSEKAHEGLVAAMLEEDWARSEPGNLRDLLERLEAGWSPLCREDPPPPGSWGVLKVSAVTSGTYLPKESKSLLPGMRPRPDIEAKPGDLLLCRANGVKRLVGVVALVKETPPGLMFSDKLMRLVVDRSRVVGDYLKLTMAGNRVRSQISAAVSGSSGQNNISQEFVMSLLVNLPDVPRQRQVAEVSDASEQCIRSLEHERSKLGILKQALMDDLLTGRVRVSESEDVLKDL